MKVNIREPFQPGQKVFIIWNENPGRCVGWEVVEREVDYCHLEWGEPTKPAVFLKTLKNDGPKQRYIDQIFETREAAEKVLLQLGDPVIELQKPKFKLGQKVWIRLYANKKWITQVIITAIDQESIHSSNKRSNRYHFQEEFVKRRENEIFETAKEALEEGK